MKEFISKIMDSKYIGTIVLVVVAIILIITGYLIYLEYQSKKNVSLNPEDVEIYQNVEDNVQNKDDNKDQISEENKDEQSKENGTFPGSLDVVSKGKNVGKALKKDKSENPFESAQAFLNNKEKLALTTDTVASISLNGVEESLVNSVKTAYAVIYGNDGKELFKSNILPKYNKITVAVDELEEREMYFAVVTVTLEDGSAFEYVFKF